MLVRKMSYNVNFVAIFVLLLLLCSVCARDSFIHIYFLCCVTCEIPLVRPLLPLPSSLPPSFCLPLSPHCSPTIVTSSLSSLPPSISPLPSPSLYLSHFSLSPCLSVSHLSPSRLPHPFPSHLPHLSPSHVSPSLQPFFPDMDMCLMLPQGSEVPPDARPQAVQS